MHDEKMAETYFRQLGYVKRENGAWIDRAIEVELYNGMI